MTPTSVAALADATRDGRAGLRGLAGWSAAAALVLATLGGRAVVARIPHGAGPGRDLAIGIAPAEVAMAIALVAWLLAIASGGRPPARPSRWLAIPALVLIAAAWLAIPMAVAPAAALDGAIRLTLVVATGRVLLDTLLPVGRLESLRGPVLAMIAVHATVAIAQVWTQGSIGLAWLGERTLDPGRPGVSVVVAEDGTRWLRAYGLTAHPNVLGGVLALGLLVLGATRSSGTGRGAALRDLVGFVVLALGSVALVLTFSRSGWLALGVGVAVVGLLAVRRRDGAESARWVRVAAVLGAAALPVLAVLAPYVASRALVAGPIPTEVRSIDERTALIELGWAVTMARPVLGTGFGGLPTAMAAARPDLDHPYAPVHLVPLQVAAELGLVAAAAVLVLLLRPWVGLLGRRGAADPRLATALALLAAVTVVALVDHYPWTSLAGRLWSVVALVAVAGSLADLERRGAGQPRAGPAA